MFLQIIIYIKRWVNLLCVLERFLQTSALARPRLSAFFFAALCVRSPGKVAVLFINVFILPCDSEERSVSGTVEILRPVVGWNPVHVDPQFAPGRHLPRKKSLPWEALGNKFIV